MRQTDVPLSPPLVRWQRREEDGALIAAYYSPCGRYLFLLGWQGKLVRIDLQLGERWSLAGHAGWLQGLAFHSDGQRAFSVDSYGNLQGWDYHLGAVQWSVTSAHGKWVRGLALDPAGELLATCAADRIVRLWSAATGELRQELTCSADLLSVAFAPGSGDLLVGDLLGRITQFTRPDFAASRVLDASTLYLRPLVNGAPEINDVGGVRHLCFHRAGDQLAAAGALPLSSGFVQGKPTVLLFDWPAGTLRQTLQLPDASGDDGFAVQTLSMPDGAWAVACSGQSGRRGLWLWRPGEDAPFFIQTDLPHVRSVCLHPDGTQLAVTSVGLRPGAITGNQTLGKVVDYPGHVSWVDVYALNSPATAPQVE